MFLAARAKMSLSRAQNIFMPANINSIVILTTLFYYESAGGFSHFSYEVSSCIVSKVTG